MLKKKKNSVWFICSSHFQTEDPEEVSRGSRGLVCPWRQKFSLICTIPTNWSPQKQCKCFLWQAFKRTIPPKEAVLILLPAWVPALRCVSTSSCAWQTGSRNWSTGNVFFLLLRFFFQRDHFPSGWEEHWMPFFSLPPSPTPPASVGLVPTLTQGLNSTEKLKKKNEVTSWLENFNFIKALFPILWRRTIHTCRTASRGKFHWQSISGQDWTKGKNTWSLEMGKLQDRKTHESPARHRCTRVLWLLLQVFSFFLACGKNWEVQLGG